MKNILNYLQNNIDEKAIIEKWNANAIRYRKVNTEPIC